MVGLATSEFQLSLLLYSVITFVKNQSLDVTITLAACVVIECDLRLIF